MHQFAIIETILRDRLDYFADIRQGIGLGNKILAMMISSFAFLATYGAVMGAAHSPQQAISSFLKLPVLFLVTLLICAPSLHFFNILFGSRQTLGQSISLLLTAITTTAIILVSFAPITFFFLITSNQYAFFKLLNVGFFAISGAVGVYFLGAGMQAVTEADSPQGVHTRRIIFLLWVLLYGFVGSQMAWTLSPFIGEPGQPFIVFRPAGGSFYSDVLSSISQLLFRGF